MNDAFRAAAVPWIAGCALAASAQAPPAPDSAVHVEKVEVTGTNIKRLDTETGLPVTVVTRRDIERSGAVTAAEMLDKVSAVNAGGFSLAQGLGNGATPGLAAVSLRGLGSNNTLVLLNGRRLSNYAFNATGGGTVNLNQIPLAAVDRIEVLKDGASAIYGTDAIGGVVNFILRKDYHGAEFSAYGTDVQRGGGDTRKYSATFGFGDIREDRFNVLAFLDYQRDSALGASQRAFASTGIRPDLGIAGISLNTVPANIRIGRNRYNASAARGCAPSVGSYQVNPANGAPLSSQPFCVYDFTSVLEIYPPSERKGLFTRAAWQIGADTLAFAEYHLSRNAITFAASETPVADFTGLGLIYYPAGGPYYPTSITLPDGSVIRPTGNLRISWRLRPAGLRRDRIDTDEDRLVAGFEGAFWGWDYSTAFSRGTSKAKDSYIDGYVRESSLGQALATGLVNVFSTARQNPEAQALIDASKIFGVVRDSDARVTSFDGKASRELFDTRNGPVAVAIGFDRRKEEIEERPQEVLYSGDILGGGGPLPPTTHAERTITSFFAELNVPVLHDLEAQLAFRHDQFSDFGGSFNPKVALRWTPATAMLFRASFGTGFRAPTLSDLFLPPAAGFTGNIRSDPLRCSGDAPIGDFVSPDECANNLPARVGGNPALQPEKSRQWTFGAVFEPSAGTSLGLDYWTIRRRNTINVVSEDAIFGAFAVADPLSAGGRFVRQPRAPGGGCVGDQDVPTPADVPCAIDYVRALIENSGKYNVSGIDVSAGWRFSRPAIGTVTLRAEGTYFLRYRFQLQTDGSYFDNAGSSTDANGVIARWRHYAALNWQRGPWDATLGHTFILGARDDDIDGFPTRRVGSYETWDLQGTWSGWKGLKVTLGVRNLFDRDPPASRQGHTFQVGYDPRYADPRGRTFYAGLKYAFR